MVPPLVAYLPLRTRNRLFSSNLPAPPGLSLRTVLPLFPAGSETSEKENSGGDLRLRSSLAEDVLLLNVALRWLFWT